MFRGRVNIIQHMYTNQQFKKRTKDCEMPHNCATVSLNCTFISMISINRYRYKLRKCLSMNSTWFKLTVQLFPQTQNHSLSSPPLIKLSDGATDHVTHPPLFLQKQLILAVIIIKTLKHKMHEVWHFTSQLFKDSLFKVYMLYFVCDFYRKPKDFSKHF